MMMEMSSIVLTPGLLSFSFNFQK